MSFRIGLPGLSIIPTSSRPVPTTVPVNTVAPSITGILTQGQTLTADPGEWTGLPSAAFTYQWQRSGVNIASATNSTYVATADDVAAGASAITVEVTGTNVIGPTTAESAGVTIAAPLAITGTPPDATVGIAYSFTPGSTGGHTPKTFALTGTLPSGLSFNTSTGAITGTPLSSGTAAGLNITVTDTDGLTAALGVFDIVVGVASAPGPSVIERFATDYATGMNGATVTPYGGATWAAYKSASGVLTSPYVSGAGKLKFLGTVATYQRNASAIVPPTVVDNRRFTWVTDPTSFVDYGTAASGIGNRFVIQVKELTPDSSHQFIRVNYLGNVAQGGLVTAAVTLTGPFDTPTTSSALAFTGDLNVQEINRGDVFAIQKVTTGAVVNINLIKNGWVFGTGTTDLKLVSGTTDVIHDDSMGVYGAGSTTDSMLAEMRMADLDTEADIWLRHDTHIAQLAFWTGTPTAANVNLDIGYSGAAPTTLTYTAYDVSAGALTPITGHVDVALTHSDGGETNRKASIQIASPPQGFVVEVKRIVTIGGDDTRFVTARTPVLFPGEKMGQDGQSRVSLFWQSSISQSVTPPSNGWSVDGSSDTITNPEDRRTQRMSTTGLRPNGDRATARLGEIGAALFGHANVEMIRSGHGGRDQQERAPSGLGLADTFAFTWDAFIEGVKRATDLGVFWVGDHAFEVNGVAGASGNSHWGSAWTDSTQIAKWKSIVYEKINQIEALVGHPILVVLSPPISILGTSSKQRAHDFETMLRDIVDTNGDGTFTTYSGVQRFYRGATLADVQHISGSDTYHLDGTAKGRGLQAFRMAHDWAMARGVSGAGRLGPDLVSAAKQSGTVIRLTFDANGATSAALRGDTGTDPSCNFEFNTATDFGAGTVLTPTAVAAPSAVSADQFTVDFTFASVPGGNIYIRAPWGQNPLNPTSGGTINADIVGLAPAIVGDFGDTGVGTTVYNPPTEAYIDLAGADYVTAA